MALVADLYGLSINETLALSEQETIFLLDKARLTFYNLATTSPDVQAIMRQRLSPTLKSVRDARKIRGVESPTMPGSGTKGPGEPPEV